MKRCETADGTKKVATSDKEKERHFRTLDEIGKCRKCINRVPRCFGWVECQVLSHPSLGSIGQCWMPAGKVR